MNYETIAKGKREKEYKQEQKQRKKFSTLQDKQQIENSNSETINSFDIESQKSIINHLKGLLNIFENFNQKNKNTITNLKDSNSFEDSNINSKTKFNNCGTKIF